MAFFWYRNNLKKTSENKFEMMKVYATNSQSNNVCNNFRLLRQTLLSMLYNPKTMPEELEQVLQKYLDLLNGILCPKLNNTQEEVIQFSNKIRQIATFTWNQSICSENESVCVDIAFECANILFQTGLYYSYCSKILMQSNNDYDENIVTKSFRFMKKAAGFFKKCQEITNNYMKDTFTADNNRKPTDLDNRIIMGHYWQCMAEAVELSIYRGEYMKFKSNISSDLYAFVLKYYINACEILSSFSTKSPPQLIKWISFINLKKYEYHCRYYLCMAEYFLDDEKCGYALKCIKDAEDGLVNIQKLIKQYQNSFTPHNTQKIPNDYYDNICKKIKLIREKVNSANSLIYHQQIINDFIPLKTDLKYGHFTETDVTFNQSDIWTDKAYEGFELKNIIL